MSSRLVAVAASALLLVPQVAFAQGDPTPPPPAAAPPAAQPAPAAAPPAAAPVAAGATGTATTPDDDADQARFRWGISGFGGPLAGGLSGGHGGIDARLGAQINETVGIYGQPMLLLGAGYGSEASATSASVSASGIALYGIGALVDATFANLFYIAAGPEILHGAMGSASSTVSTTGTSQSAAGSTGPYFSIATRLGFAFGSMKPKRRKAFTVGLDMRIIFNPGDPVLTPGLALGYDSF